MPGKAAKVTITERQQAILIEFSKSRSEPLHVRQRATIVLRAFQGRSNAEIAAEVGLERHQVGVWRRRWRDSWPDLTRHECLEPRRLREALREMFRDAPRLGAKGKFTAEQVTAIVAVACEPPEKSGRPITHWTRHELRDEVVKRGIVPSISVSQIGRYLNDAALQPHRRAMWLNTTEKDPVQFQQQVDQACATYQTAAARHAEDGTHTACIDEMTGLQALERAAPDKAAAPGHVAKQEFEYVRHGTTTLIGTFQVLTGLLFVSLGLTRTEADFLAHVMRTVARDPSAGWVLVVDCLNIHCSASLVEWVAKLCGVREPLGKKGRHGVLRSQASRRAFLSDVSHRIRMVYLPKHSSWLNQIETVFGIVMRKVVRRGSFTSVADLETKLRAFVEYYNQVMAHPFRWTYTGKPLAPTRRTPFCPKHRHLKLLRNDKPVKRAA